MTGTYLGEQEGKVAASAEEGREGLGRQIERRSIDYLRRAAGLRTVIEHGDGL